MDWQECNMKKMVKSISADEELLKSLLKTSENKIISAELLVLNDTTANSKISLAYDSLRELLEALALKNGFKIYNHECYTAFLKEILKESSLGDDFDEMRKLRNSINYYGEQVNKEECEKIIKQIKNIIQQVKRKLK